MEVFESFYLRAFPKVVRVVWGLAGDLAAEDVAQEAFWIAYLNWDQGERISRYDSPDAWVCKVAMRLAGRWRHRWLAGKRKSVLAFYGSGEVVEHSDIPADRLEFWHQFRKLPGRLREVLALHYVGGYKVAEVAAVLEISEGAVKRYLHDGRQALADLLRSGQGDGEQHER